MIVSLALLGYAVGLATFGPSLLIRAPRVEQAPRLAIASWQALTASVVISAVMAALAVTVPTIRVSGDLSNLLRSCVMALRAQYATPGGAAVGATGAVLALGIVARIGWSVAVTTSDAARERARHRRVLDMVGYRDDARGIVILECDDSAVYCLPGIRRRTVVTTAALLALDADQLTAVLAHEQAHLAERHDVIIGFAAALARAFAGLAVFREAANEIARLVELRADDVAASKTSRLTVAGALLAVTSSSPSRTPTTVLAAGGDGAAARVRRLISLRNPMGRVASIAVSAALLVLLTVPVLVLGEPAMAATHENLCPPGVTSQSM